MHDIEFVWSARSNELEFSVEFLIRMIDNEIIIISNFLISVKSSTMSLDFEIDRRKKLLQVIKINLFGKLSLF